MFESQAYWDPSFQNSNSEQFFHCWQYMLDENAFEVKSPLVLLY